MSADRLARRVWHGDGPGASLARLALLPFEVLFRAGSAIHRGTFSSGIRTVHRATVPVVSVGNLNVGGSGKTPVAAHIVSLLAQQGHRPSVVMRGYGDDEPLVHARLNPGAPVIVEKNRVIGARRATSEYDSDVVVLDDAFQHLSLHRDLDIVVFSADAPFGRVRMLPAGPWRESLSALARASLVIISRKSATDENVSMARKIIERKVPEVPLVVGSLRLDRLHSTSGEVQPLSLLSGKSVLVVSAIADPAALSGQIVAAGATPRHATFGDHHAFGKADVESILRNAKGCDFVVCTLKDAVKLQSIWPRDGIPLWYVSQAVEFGSGTQILHNMLHSLFHKSP